MRYPQNFQTTSTHDKLGKGPQDMPDRGGPKVNFQSSSSMEKLSRTPNHVAAFGAKPGMGSIQTTSTQERLNRNATSPYDNISKTTPQLSAKGKGKKR